MPEIATTERAAMYSTPMGAAWVYHDGDRITGCALPGTRRDRPRSDHPPPRVRALVAALEAYWSGGELPRLDGPMRAAAASTDLQAAIYDVVSAIPAGETMTYRQVAEAVGRQGAARAVGAAMAANRFAPMIPCHRVVGSDGTLRGYAGGLEMKRALLEMERSGRG